MEVVDNIPVINLHNSITVSKVPLDVVAEGLVGLLDDAGQIPSDEGAIEFLPAVDGAGC